MGQNTAQYNLGENGAHSGDGTGSMVGPGGGSSATMINNVLWNGANGTSGAPYGNYTINAAAFGYGGACPTTALFANIITVAHVGNNGAHMVSGGYYAVAQNCKTVIYKSNDWYALSGYPYFRAVLNGVSYIGATALTNWQNASGDTGPNTNGNGTNPNFANGGGGLGTTCYVPGTMPGNIGAASCPNNYLLQTGSSLIGSALDLSQPPYDLIFPATDYYNVAIPNGTGTTGYNYGADGAHH
jgi:hypothetical protein